MNCMHVFLAIPVIYKQLVYTFPLRDKNNNKIYRAWPLAGICEAHTIFIHLTSSVLGHWSKPLPSHSDASGQMHLYLKNSLPGTVYEVGSNDTVHYSHCLNQYLSQWVAVLWVMYSVSGSPFILWLMGS